MDARDILKLYLDLMALSEAGFYRPEDVEQLLGANVPPIIYTMFSLYSQFVGGPLVMGLAVREQERRQQ